MVLRCERLLLLLTVEVVILTLLFILRVLIMADVVAIRLPPIIVLLEVAELVGACMLLVLPSIVLLGPFPLRLLRHSCLLLAIVLFLSLVCRGIFEFVCGLAFVVHFRVIDGLLGLA